MKDIDLTKCNNCRFRAEISNSGPVSGRIVVDKGVYLVDEKENIIGFLSLDGEEIMSMSGCGITGFEIIPRDPEIYRDWQAGDKVCKDERRNACYEVIFRSGELVVMKTNANTACSNYTCDELFGCGYRLVLTDIEQQIIEEKKKYKPQDGDIVAWKDEEYCIKSAVSIYKEGNRGYATIFANGLTEYSTYATFAMDIIRPATDEEKQMLFDAMAKEGKRWNAEKKVVEDIPKPYEFKKGEPVLVRDYGGFWKIGVLTKMQDSYCRYVVTTDGVNECGYRQCLPYNERTMHLLGTTEDYKEE